MITKRTCTFKSSFLSELKALPSKEIHQVLEKIDMLSEDPRPDGKAKVQLKHVGDKSLYRLRCGDYRIIYTFEELYISLLALRRRREDTYDDDLSPEFLGGFNPELDATKGVSLSRWERFLAPQEPEKRFLPEPITQDLLANLHVPEMYRPRLLRVQTEDDLLNCPGVPEEILTKILDYMFPRSMREVLQQPDYIVPDVNDLLRYKEGELIAFLLKLSSEQEKYVNWAINASGPTLVKGGPGTGKSTVALYRVRSLIQNFPKIGQFNPRILFTTYTNALVRSSEQLLKQLLGDDLHHVKVVTADKIVSDILERAGTPKRIPRDTDHTTLSSLFGQAWASVKSNADTSERQALERLGHRYVQEEIEQMIMARQVATLQDYFHAPRPGRKMRLSNTDKKAVWLVYQTFSGILKQKNVETWQQARVRAEVLVTQDREFRSYDAVIVDEAQDLDPGVLRLLINLCKTPNRLFITADANQSIYGSSFAWTDVHEGLKFRGRTGVLRANYRSTREIGEAAQSYLSAGILDSEPVERFYVNTGGIMPAVWSVQNPQEEIRLLARFLQRATHEVRQGLGSCVVLCPNEGIGDNIARQLTQYDIPASFMKGRKLDLTVPRVKVLTLNSAKGLEFPVVVLAGFFNTQYVKYSDSSNEEEISRARRVLFVGMTRAMHILLVTIPTGTLSPLLTGFNTEYWNVG